MHVLLREEELKMNKNIIFPLQNGEHLLTRDSYNFYCLPNITRVIKGVMDKACYVKGVRR
jgi:hypothetical protein